MEDKQDLINKKLGSFIKDLHQTQEEIAKVRVDLNTSMSNDFRKFSQEQKGFFDDSH
jgi:hypothetical protein